MHPSKKIVYIKNMHSIYTASSINLEHFFDFLCDLNVISNDLFMMSKKNYGDIYACDA